jgi:hypothetical protein
MWQHRSSHLGKAESGAVRHMATSELTSVWSRETRGSARAHLSKEREVWSHGTRGNDGPYLCREVWTRDITGAHLS